MSRFLGPLKNGEFGPGQKRLSFDHGGHYEEASSETQATRSMETLSQVQQRVRPLRARFKTI